MKTVLRVSLVVCVVLLCGMERVNGQWVQTGLNYSEVVCFAISDTCLFAGSYGRGVFLSTDNGNNWNNVSSGLGDGLIEGLTISGANLYAGTNMHGVYRSTNNGSSWSAFNNGMPQGNSIHSLATLYGKVFAATLGGVFSTFNDDTSWTDVNTGLTDKNAGTLYVSGSNLYASTWGYGGIFYSTDYGALWTKFDSSWNKPYVWAFAELDSNLFVGTSVGSVLKSTNNGVSWTEVNAGLPKSWVYALVVSGKNLIAGIYNNGVFLSSNSGTNWISVNDNLPEPSVFSLTIYGTDLFAGTAHNGIWKRPLSELITGIEGQQKEFPSAFTLDQNYPNPFSPSTTISFTIPSRSFVSLKIFDLIGREVSTLVDRDLDVGEHSYKWNPEGLRSGVYLCRVQAGSFVATQKLSLLR